MTASQMGGNDAAFLRAVRRPARVVARPLRVVDLFSGCGGLTLGVSEAARAAGRGVDVRLGVEIDAKIAAVYAMNFDVLLGRLRRDVKECFERPPGSSLSANERDIVRLVGQVDILVGGPPCQGHSTLNNHTRGNDPKNELYLSMVRAAELLGPSMMIVENVPAVERDSGRAVVRARELLTKAGYSVDSAVVSLADIGVPQLRRRHVLVATRDKALALADVIVSASVARHRDLEWAIGDLRRAPGHSLLDEPSAMTRENLKRASFLLRNELHDLPNRLRPPCQRGEHKYKSMYGRLRWDAPAQTITTGFGSPGQGRYLHPEEPRTLTPHEAARIQFFPDWFRFDGLRRSELAKAIGNAVPPKLSFVIAAHFLARSENATGARGYTARGSSPLQQDGAVPSRE